MTDPDAFAARLGSDLALEILQEKASTLARLANAFERKLADLHACEADQPAQGADSALPREKLIEAAGEALWNFIVQREACGFRNTEVLLKDYAVPLSVRLRLGVSRRR